MLPTVSNDVLALLALITTIMGTVWTLAWWLSNKFNAMMKIFYDKIDSAASLILDKLEYHERHDDVRFNTINNDLWTLRLRNARVDGEIQPQDHSTK